MTRVTEADMTGLLHRRYSARNQAGLPRYITAPQVPLNIPDEGVRIADFLALDSQTVEVWREWLGEFVRYPPPVHGFEIKVSRADWLAEHRTAGEKSEAWRSYCNYWWIVVPHRELVKPEELPVGWGLLAGTKRLQQVVKPTWTYSKQMDKGLILNIARYSQRSKK